MSVNSVARLTHLMEIPGLFTRQPSASHSYPYYSLKRTSPNARPTQSIHRTSQTRDEIVIQSTPFNLTLTPAHPSLIRLLKVRPETTPRSHWANTFHHAGLRNSGFSHRLQADLCRCDVILIGSFVGVGKTMRRWGCEFDQALVSEKLGWGQVLATLGSR